MTYRSAAFFLSLLLLFALGGCDQGAPTPELESDRSGDLEQGSDGLPGTHPLGGTNGAFYEFAPPVFDISTSPNGSILVAETGNAGAAFTTSALKEITPQGIRDFAEVTTVEGSPVNGLHHMGRGGVFATSGGLDLAVGAGVWHVTRGQARMIGDVETFESAADPDAFEGPQWKPQACEATGGFSAGPQSNPFHLTRLTGSTALVADGAGNTLLSVKKNGTVDWVAVFTPPVKDGVNKTSSLNPSDWRELYTTPDDIPCYVQPVPTAVAVGPGGDYYVGELTGALASGLPVGLSRVWRIDAGARGVTCPSNACDVALSGFTSIIDVVTGPDDLLYVVEYDANSWLASVVPAIPLGLGTISRCNPAADNVKADCDVVESGITLPAAIAFDGWGRLWLLENNLVTPTVRPVASGMP